LREDAELRHVGTALGPADEVRLKRPTGPVHVKKDEDVREGVKPPETISQPTVNVDF